MIKKISKLITTVFVNNSIIKAEDRDIYNYCFEITIVSIMSYLILLILSILLNEFVCSLIFLVSFTVFRKISGGYHTSNYIKCFIMSITSYLLMILVIKKYFQIFVGNYFMLAVGLIIIILFSPIQDRNKPFTNKQYKIFKFLSKSLAILLLLIFTILQLSELQYFFINEYYFSFCYGIDLVAFSLLISKIRRRFKDAKN